jgi:hypothetical protein
MVNAETPAEEVLNHSEDEGEWEETPEQIDSRPTGSQVISTRLPTALAEELLAQAASRKIRMSDLVRQAVEAFLHTQAHGVSDIVAYPGINMRVTTPLPEQRTENFNLVVQIDTEPTRVEAVEAVA